MYLLKTYISGFMRKSLFILFISFACISSLKAQQLPLYNQYMLNGYLVNPAVAGSDGYTTFSLTARSQWLGIPNAPNTQVFSFQTRVLKRSFIVKGNSVKRKSFKPSRSGRIGLGAYVFNDMNGAMSRTGVHASYAYHIRIGENQLSFGLGGTAYQFHIQDLSFFEENEPLLSEGIYQPVFVPDADFGIYYLSYKYYAGISVKNVMQSYLKLGNTSLDGYRLYRHYYVTGGYRFEINSRFALEPSGMFRMSSQLSPQMDFNVKAYFMENIWAGLSFRTNGSLVSLFGVKVDRYYFGYAFDMGFSSIMKHTFGSHEFMLSVKLGDNARRYRWIERY